MPETYEAPEHPWWADHRNVFQVAQSLVGEGADAAELLDLIEKPWKWQDQWVKVRSAMEGERAAAADLREARTL